MNRLLIIVFLFFQLNFILFGNQTKKTGPKKDEVSITNLKFRGNGCKKENTSVIITSSKEDDVVDYFQMVYNDFGVIKGPNVPSSNRQRGCFILFSIEYPKKWAYSFTSVDYDGYAEIGEKSTGRFKTNYEFPFIKDQESYTETKLKGPYVGKFNQDQSTGIFKQIWSPCHLNSPLEIRSFLTLIGPKSEFSEITIDVQSGYLNQKFALQWKLCKEIYN